jgi:hypothetical protein
MAISPSRNNVLPRRYPQVGSLAKNLQNSLDLADKLNVDDAQTIWNEAAKITKNEDKS